jgi:hypothetical protein
MITFIDFVVNVTIFKNIVYGMYKSPPFSV